MSVTDDLYCLTVTRYGAAGIEEDEGKVALHAVPRENVDRLLELLLRSLGPGDQAEIKLSRGLVHERL